jgi:hypothetical protein
MDVVLRVDGPEGDAVTVGFAPEDATVL